MKLLKNNNGSLLEVETKKSGVSIGTGLDQIIIHGFGTTWTKIQISIIALETGVEFTNYSFDKVNGKDHFHITVTTNKNWAWIAEIW